VEKTAAMFEILAENTAKKVLLNGDDAHLTQLKISNSVRFSLNQPSDYRAENLELKELSSEFNLRGIRFLLNMPGRYNVYNAVACLAVLSEFGIALERCVGPLSKFKGIDRRFDVYLNNNKGFVMDDYAHNPHKIASMMEMAGRIRPSINYVFQPHGFAPTRLMRKEYIESFSRHLRPEDKLHLLPIYYVGGTVAKDISSDDIANGVKAIGGNACVTSRERLISDARPEESYIIFGARDESLAQLAASLADKMNQDQASPTRSTSKTKDAALC
jgi:UDP-N-acetylmuramate--alanine ligase